MVEAARERLFRRSEDPERARIKQKTLEAEFLKALPSKDQWIAYNSQGYERLQLRGKLLNLFTKLRDLQSRELIPFTEVNINGDIWLSREIEEK